MRVMRGAARYAICVASRLRPGISVLLAAVISLITGFGPGLGALDAESAGIAGVAFFDGLSGWTLSLRFRSSVLCLDRSF